MNSKNVAYLFAVFAALLLLLFSGCAGSNNTSGTTPPPPTSTIASVSVSCALNSVPVGQTSQCSAKVQGTGSFSQTVSWSVSGIPGGNLSVGVITPSGLYTAPSAVPTPYTVNITATSAQDGTKSAFTSVLVAGTIATTSQTVTAASGATIVLPDGSGATIPSGLLPSDQTVTLSELSAPQAYPAGSIVNAGPLLDLVLSLPMPNIKLRHPRKRSARPDDSSTSIQFSVAIGANANSTLQGSAPIVNLTIASGGQTILFPSGSYDATNQIGQIYLDSSYLSGVKEVSASMANFDSTLPIMPKSREVYWDSPSHIFQALAQTDTCPLSAHLQKQDSDTLVLVHGIASSVEGAFSGKVLVNHALIQTYVPDAIASAGGYGLVVGFDYDYTQPVKDSGGELASFLNSLASCSGIQRLDIEAHSEGVAVTLAAGASGAIAVSTAKLMKNFVSLAGPIKGTPLADFPEFLSEYYAPALIALDEIPAALAGDLLALITAQGIPALQDLTSTNDPLSSIRQNFGRNLPGIDITAVGGDGPTYWIFNSTVQDTVFSGHVFDDVMPLDSALGFNSGMTLHPLPPFLDDHSQLHDDQDVISDVGKQVLQGMPPQATLTCESSETSCDASQTQTFALLFSLSNRSLDSSYLKVYVQDTNGNVTQQAPTFSDAEGGITWSWKPSCSSPPCDFSVFSLDAADTLASNSVLATVQPGTASAGIAFSPASLDFGSVLIGSSAVQSVTLTSTGTVDLQIAQLSLTNNSGTFSDSSQCGTTLSVGASCSISITFSPTHELSESATLTVTDNANGSPQSVPLSGTGTITSQVPSVTTGAATAITSNSTTLAGTVNPNGSDTQVWFQYSTNSSMSGAISTPQQDIGAGTTTVPFSANLYPLNPGTTYYYQAMASNTVGSAPPAAVLNFSTTSQGLTLTSFTISPPTVTSGQSATLTLGLSGTPSQTATISLSPISSAFPVPGTINIQAGQSSTSFSVTSGTVSSATTVTITASYNGSSVQAQVTVNPIAPIITSIAPNPVIASPSDQPIGIFGANFQSGDTLTFVDTAGGVHQSVPSKLTFVSSSQIDYEINDNSDIGIWTVTVNSPDGSVHSNTFSFNVAMFTIGENVMVSGTGGIGLNLRTCASTSCTAVVDMPDGTVMGVIGGPSNGDGYTWWNLSGTVNGTSYSGWAIQNYLVPD